MRLNQLHEARSRFSDDSLIGQLDAAYRQATNSGIKLKHVSEAVTGDDYVRAAVALVNGTNGGYHHMESLSTAIEDAASDLKKIGDVENARRTVQRLRSFDKSNVLRAMSSVEDSLSRLGIYLDADMLQYLTNLAAIVRAVATVKNASVAQHGSALLRSTSAAVLRNIGLTV